MGSYVLETPASEEPVSLPELKDALRIQHTSEDEYLKQLLALGREEVEDETQRQLVTATWKLHLDGFPYGAIELEKPPIRSVGSIQYVDTTGDTQALAASKYRVDTTCEPGRITPAYGESWPSTRAVTGAVIVTFDAGYGLASAVPLAAKQLVKVIARREYDGTDVSDDYEKLLRRLRWAM